MRCINIKDAGFYLKMVNEPSWIKNIGDRGIHDVQQAEAALLNGPIASQHKNGFSLYIVERKEDSVAMGICGLIKRDYLETADIGYAFLPEYWGRGYALEAAQSVLHYAREELGMTSIAAMTFPDNLSSQHLLRKLGFSLIDVLTLEGDQKKTHLYVQQDLSEL
ncbi:GNAT family N-acetyltransferase [Undibacterium sp. SXout7W]|uniref:GNAT family N-acetyltransferase n=1 Tax=Undibacterium sp. SXout7W TaxID=3413049 RepID=UPI003BF58D93